MASESTKWLTGRHYSPLMGSFGILQNPYNKRTTKMTKPGRNENKTLVVLVRRGASQSKIDCRRSHWCQCVQCQQIGTIERLMPLWG
eukprot:6459907-Amphidinium_carterae.1